VSNNTITISAVLKNISDYALEDKTFDYEEVKVFGSRNIVIKEVKTSV
jgi:hypothetical protein